MYAYLCSYCLLILTVNSVFFDFRLSRELDRTNRTWEMKLAIMQRKYVCETKPAKE